jgi:secreted trypsin-like serine protease
MSMPPVKVLHDQGFCTGIVVAPDVVLTAAQCVRAGVVGIGVQFLEAGQLVLIAAQRVALHPEYRVNAVQERVRSIDMALIRLQRPLPARFSPATLSTQTSPTAASVTAAGFGVAREGDASTSGSWAAR